MKYSITGHSCVQEVDNMHKQIEDVMQEFYSPISFLRLLLKANRKDPYRVIQMEELNFKDFMISAKLLHYNLVPYQKLLQLKFEQQNLHELKFKFSQGDTEFQTINIGRHASAARRSKTASVVRYPVQVMEEKEINIVSSRKQKREKEISESKKADLISMLKYMPQLDREYYKSIGITMQQA